MGGVKGQKKLKGRRSRAIPNHILQQRIFELAYAGSDAGRGRILR